VFFDLFENTSSCRYYAVYLLFSYIIIMFTSAHRNFLIQQHFLGFIYIYFSIFNWSKILLILLYTKRRKKNIIKWICI